MVIKYKKGDELITEQVIFIILNLVFFSALLFFIIRSGSSDAVYEETYAKKLALILDGMNENMEVNVSIETLVEGMEKNNVLNQIPVSVNNNLLNVKITKSGLGYNFHYFSKLTPQFFLDRQNKILTIKT
jgi:hypothetical protein